MPRKILKSRPPKQQTPKPVQNASTDPEPLPECHTPEELIERECLERDAEVIDKWWYRDRYGEGMLLRYRLEADDSDVILQTVRKDGVWVGAWPAEKKVPLYRVYEGFGKSPVFVVEGEYAAEAAIAMGLSAVTPAGGEEDVERTDWRPMAGREVIITPRNSQAGRAFGRAAARMVLGLDPAPVVRMLTLPGLEEGQDIGDFGWDLKLSPTELGNRVRELAAREPVMKPADLADLAEPKLVAGIRPAPLRWLWPGRVPIGKPVVIFGGVDPGKSILALNLAAMVSTGAEWPGGTGERAPRGNVILMCDDDLGDTIRPRLDEAGADAQRIFALNTVMGVVEGKEVRRDITLRDLAELERAIERIGNVRLLVIDPLAAFFSTDVPARRQVRRAISGLRKLARRHGLAVVMIAEQGGRDGPGLAANHALVSAVHSVFLVHEEPGDRRLLLPLKRGPGQAPGSLACSIKENAVEWEPAPIFDSAGVLESRRSLPGAGLSVATGPLAVAMPSSSACLDAAAQWLAGQLADGPVPVGAPKRFEPGTLRAAAESAGLAWSTVHRASKDMGVVTERSSKTRKSMWRLPVAIPLGDPKTQGTDKNEVGAPAASV